MWESGRKKITTEYEKLLKLLCFVNEFPKTKRRKYLEYTSEYGCYYVEIQPAILSSEWL